MTPRASALLVCAALCAAAAFDAIADDRLARFDGGIGSQPFAATQGTFLPPVANNVFNVNPGGRPWVIEKLRADVHADGRIRVDGRGLLLAGGNGIGTTGGQSVRARLFCGTVQHDSDEAVPLEPNGDFRIDSFLTPRPPNPCNTPVLLIVNAPPSGNPVWFAAGIPKH